MKRYHFKNNARILIVFILFVFVNLTVFGTAQVADKIIYNGQEYMLFSNPMESFFAQYPEKRPEGGIITTASWRGYVATFEIKDNQLYLKDIEIDVYIKDEKVNDKYSSKSVLNEIFPNQEHIKIDWLTGILVIPHGELVNYVHMGYASTYENYILLEIDKGDLKNEKQFNSNDYEKFKERQFQAFKKTEDYKKIRDNLRKEGGGSRKFIDTFLKIYVIEYTSKILVE